MIAIENSVTQIMPPSSSVARCARRGRIEPARQMLEQHQRKPAMQAAHPAASIQTFKPAADQAD
jgi:hypothetical protein